MPQELIIGTRASILAIWQAEYVKNLIIDKFPNINIKIKKIKTKGDLILNKPLHQIGDKGLFTKELENALLNNEIDIAVHSLKDLQTELPQNLIISAVTKRDYPFDVLIAKEKNARLQNIKSNAKIATGSLRRKAQLLAFRRDFQIIDIRGNIDTRIKKLFDADIDGLILARAGIERLGFSNLISEEISPELITPAVGQGALALQINANNEYANEITSSINEKNTFIEISAERRFLIELGGGCHNPIAAFATINSNNISIMGMVSDTEGINLIRFKKNYDIDLGAYAGSKLAQIFIENGAKEILRL